MKVMISQPMRGKTNGQIKEERKSLVEKLSSKGYEVVDTIISQTAPKDIDESIYYLSKSIADIGKVDAVVFMKGWETARGCVIEHEVAKNYGKFILEEEKWAME